MANPCELSLTVVMLNKPKVLRGLAQKGRGPDRGLVPSPTQTTRPSADRQSLPIGVHARNVVSPTPSREGQRPVKGAYGAAGRGGGSKRKPRCNGADRG